MRFIFTFLLNSLTFSLEIPGSASSEFSNESSLTLLTSFFPCDVESTEVNNAVVGTVLRAREDVLVTAVRLNGFTPLALAAKTGELNRGPPKVFGEVIAGEIGVCRSGVCRRGSLLCWGNRLGLN